MKVIKAMLSDTVEKSNTEQVFMRAFPNATPVSMGAHQAPLKLSPLQADTLADFLNRKLPAKEFILEPILPTQGTALLYAIRGLGKTFTAIAIALAVATGGTVFHWKASKPRKVLYIDGEMPAPTMQERLAEAVQHQGVELPAEDYFRLITPDRQEQAMPDIASKEGQAMLAPFVADAEFIVIDNLSTLCRTGKENEADGWLPVQQWVLELRRMGKSVLMVHHAGKGGQQRGTSRREDILDTVFTLKRPDDYNAAEGARFEVHFEKARGLHGDAAKPFEAMLTPNGWTVKDIEDRTLERVMALTAEGLTVRDIAEELSLSKSQVSRLQKKARMAAK